MTEIYLKARLKMDPDNLPKNLLAKIEADLLADLKIFIDRKGDIAFFGSRSETIATVSIQDALTATLQGYDSQTQTNNEIANSIDKQQTRDEAEEMLRILKIKIEKLYNYLMAATYYF
jgi:hypothetical protein